jgi:predicted negative regulator of RcsB-dependent stress response
MAEEYLTDDEQWEAIKRGIAENGLWVVAGVVLGVALLVGWRYYQSHQNQVAMQAAGAFGAMTTALEINDKPKSRQLAAGLIQNFPQSPYADQAKLILARLDVEEGKPASAEAPLTEVMTSSKDTELQHIARLRLARLLIDQGKPDDALQTLAADTPGPFAGRYHEVRGDAYTAKKDVKDAVTEYKAALDGSDLGNADMALLELKLADLGQPPTPPTPLAALSTPAAPATKAALPVTPNKATN